MVALVIGLLLQPAVLSPVAWAATAALAVFAMLIARSLARGERFSCFCFGDSEATLSRLTLARTVALTALGVVVVFNDATLAGQPAPDVILEAVVAIGLVGLAMTAVRMPKLWRWNRDPFGLRDELWIERPAP
jgi:methylamine utilization protein MauE